MENGEIQIEEVP
jgi:DNA-directed RNA polymerase II subunit RPB2